VTLVSNKTHREATLRHYIKSLQRFGGNSKFSTW